MRGSRRIEVGDVFNTKEGDKVEVVEYVKATKIVVKHRYRGHFTSVSADRLRKGMIKNPYWPSVFGVGYLGVGEHKTSEGGRHTPHYKSWQRMLQRAYCPQYQAKHPTYRGMGVCPDWHNFQTFSTWWEEQPNAGRKGFTLDKDLIVGGNKEYGPKVCSFVPQEMNTILNDCSSARGDLPQGVSKSRKGFRVRLNKDGKEEHLGTFPTPEIAHELYCLAKEEYVAVVALRYKGDLRTEVYNYLVNYRIGGR